MIVPMKRLTLVALQSEEARILQALQAISAVQIIETDEATFDDAALAKAENRVAQLNAARKLLKPYAPKKSMLSPKPEASVQAIFQDLPEALEVSVQLEETDHKRASVRSQMDKQQSLIEALLPWEELPVPIEQIRSTRSTKVLTGIVKADQLPLLEPLAQLTAVEFYGEGARRAVLVVCSADVQQEVEQTLKDADWTEYHFPPFQGTVKANLARLNREFDALKAEEADLQTRLETYAAKYDLLSSACDAATIDLDRERALNELNQTDATFILEGWMRADQQDLVRSTIEGVTDAFDLSVRNPRDDEVPPSVMKNKTFSTPYEAVTSLYSRPDPRAIDGTPYMAPWYMLLFGMMLSDSGYGLVLAIGCFLYLKLVKPGGMAGSLSKVVMMGGLSTIVWGVLIGTFFGLDFDVVFGTTDLFPLILDPMTDPINMLFLCFGIGLLHIICGILLKVKLCFSRGDWQGAIFDQCSWLLILLGLIAMFAVPALSTYGTIAVILGAAMILLMKGRGKRNPIKRLISGFGELYNVTSFLSDVLSYARLFALGIATGVIATVFNSLAGMLMGSPNIILNILGIAVAVVMLVFLHLFNVAINALGAFVHCARLQYVEFYGKFYEGGGKEFKPLGYQTRHVKIARS